MLDMYTDFTAVHAQIGAHVEVPRSTIWPPRRDRKNKNNQMRAKVDEIEATFDFADPSSDPIAGPIEPERWSWSARVAVGSTSSPLTSTCKR